MSDKHHVLIDELADAVENNDRSLTPIKKLIPVWLFSLVCVVTAGMLIRAPFRANWVDQLAQPYFLIESFLGLMLCLTICVAAFRSSIPGLPTGLNYLLWSWVRFGCRSFLSPFLS